MKEASDGGGTSREQKLPRHYEETTCKERYYCNEEGEKGDMSKDDSLKDVVTPGDLCDVSGDDGSCCNAVEGGSNISEDDVTCLKKPLSRTPTSAEGHTGRLAPLITAQEAQVPQHTDLYRESGWENGQRDESLNNTSFHSNSDYTSEKMSDNKLQEGNWQEMGFTFNGNKSSEKEGIANAGTGESVNREVSGVFTKAFQTHNPEIDYMNQETPCKECYSYQDFQEKGDVSKDGHIPNDDTDISTESYDKNTCDNEDDVTCLKTPRKWGKGSDTNQANTSHHTVTEKRGEKVPNNLTENENGAKVVKGNNSSKNRGIARAGTSANMSSGKKVMVRESDIFFKCFEAYASTMNHKCPGKADNVLTSLFGLFLLLIVRKKWHASTGTPLSQTENLEKKLSTFRSCHDQKSWKTEQNLASLQQDKVLLKNQKNLIYGSFEKESRHVVSDKERRRAQENEKDDPGLLDHTEKTPTPKGKSQCSQRLTTNVDDYKPQIDEDRVLFKHGEPVKSLTQRLRRTEATHQEDGQPESGKLAEVAGTGLSEEEKEKRVTETERLRESAPCGAVDRKRLANRKNEDHRAETSKNEGFKPESAKRVKVVASRSSEQVHELCVKRTSVSTEVRPRGAAPPMAEKAQTGKAGAISESKARGRQGSGEVASGCVTTRHETPKSRKKKSRRGRMKRKTKHPDLLSDSTKRQVLPQAGKRSSRAPGRDGCRRPGETSSDGPRNEARAEKSSPLALEGRNDSRPGKPSRCTLQTRSSARRAGKQPQPTAVKRSDVATPGEQSACASTAGDMHRSRKQSRRRGLKRRDAASAQKPPSPAAARGSDTPGTEEPLLAGLRAGDVPAPRKRSDSAGEMTASEARKRHVDKPVHPTANVESVVRRGRRRNKVSRLTVMSSHDRSEADSDSKAGILPREPGGKARSCPGREHGGKGDGGRTGQQSVPDSGTSRDGMRRTPNGNGQEDGREAEVPGERGSESGSDGSRDGGGDGRCVGGGENVGHQGGRGEEANSHGNGSSKGVDGQKPEEVKNREPPDRIRDREMTHCNMDIRRVYSVILREPSASTDTPRQEVYRQIDKCFVRCLRKLSDPRCPTCSPMKAFLKHVAKCLEEQWNVCKICRFVLRVIQNHVRRCSDAAAAAESGASAASAAAPASASASASVGADCELVLCVGLRQQVRRLRGSENRTCDVSSLLRNVRVWKRIKRHLCGLFEVMTLAAPGPETGPLVSLRLDEISIVISQPMVEPVGLPDQLPTSPVRPSPTPPPSPRGESAATGGVSRVKYGTRKAVLDCCRACCAKAPVNPAEADCGGGVIFESLQDFLVIGRDGRYHSGVNWHVSIHLGRGMSGNCSLAVDASTSFKFAVKEVHVDKFDMLEVEILTQLRHPNICSCYGVLREDENVIILLQYVEGRSLAEQIEAHGRLNERTSLVIFAKIIQVLIYLRHRKILHEDLKPDNIILQKGTVDIVLVDFGLSRCFSRTYPEVPRNAKPVGAQTQMSPEKAACQGYSYESDLWAAGCVLCAMVSGHLPWTRRFDVPRLEYIIVSRSPPVQDIPTYVSEPVRDLIKWLWTVNRAERPLVCSVPNHSALSSIDVLQVEPLPSSRTVSIESSRSSGTDNQSCFPSFDPMLLPRDTNAVDNNEVSSGSPRSQLNSITDSRSVSEGRVREELQEKSIPSGLEGNGNQAVEGRVETSQDDYLSFDIQEKDVLIAGRPLTVSLERTDDQDDHSSKESAPQVLQNSSIGRLDAYNEELAQGNDGDSLAGADSTGKPTSRRLSKARSEESSYSDNLSDYERLQKLLIEDKGSTNYEEFAMEEEAGTEEDPAEDERTTLSDKGTLIQFVRGDAPEIVLCQMRMHNQLLWHDIIRATISTIQPQYVDGYNVRHSNGKLVDINEWFQESSPSTRLLICKPEDDDWLVKNNDIDYGSAAYFVTSGHQ